MPALKTQRKRLVPHTKQSVDGQFVRHRICSRKFLCADMAGGRPLRLCVDSTPRSFERTLGEVRPSMWGPLGRRFLSPGRWSLTLSFLSTVHPAVVIRQRKSYRRKDGVFLYFEDNAGVIVNNKGEMKGLLYFFIHSFKQQHLHDRILW